MTQYNNTENVLQLINSRFVTLDNATVRHNNQVLRSTLAQMISIMRELDPLFHTLYEETYYGGSYYDDLKVGAPNEFDLDLLLSLPRCCQSHRTRTCGCIKVIPSNKPGYFWFKVQPDYLNTFNRFINNGYVQTNLVISWLQSVVTRALSTLDGRVDFTFPTPSYNSQSGPALTLRLFGEFGIMDVDLVPAFKFGSAHWPGRPYRSNPSNVKSDFFIVPKKAKGVAMAERYWRASFQNQERELINGRQRLKPALRLLKKLRNNLGHDSICSYALKTIVLWEVDAGSIDWNSPLSTVFLELLERYRDRLQAKTIPYYWNRNGNLLEGIRPETLANHCNEITRKINAFRRNFDSNPMEIAKIILREGGEEYRLLLIDCRRGGNNVAGSGTEREPSFIGRSSTTTRPTPPTSGGPSSQGTQEQASYNAGGWLAGIAAAAIVGMGIISALFRNRD